MANYRFTDYTVEGDGDELGRFRQLIDSLEADGDEKRFEDLLEALREDKKMSGRPEKTHEIMLKIW